MARILTELKPPDDVTGLLLGYHFHTFRQLAIIVLHRELSPVLCTEAEMLVLDLPLENKLGNKPFHPKECSAVNFFGHIESIANLPGAETHWQDNW